MEPQYFSLKDGSLRVDGGLLVIEDKAMARSWLNSLSVWTVFIYAVATAIGGYKNSDSFWLYYGIILAGCLLIIGVLRRDDFRKPENEIPIIDLSRAVVKKYRFFKKKTTILLFLPLGKTRAIHLADDGHQLPAFLQLLAEYQVKVTGQEPLL